MAITLERRHSIRIAVAIIIALAIGLFAWSFLHPFEKPAPQTQPEVSSLQPIPQEPTADEPIVDEVEASTLDPENVSTVAIEPLGINVSYVKGIEGFSYNVSQTGVGTQYVELQSEQLIGTKCTDDDGSFATIVKNPKSDEDKTTLSLTKKVGNDTYGLSLPSNTCTSDTALFAQYQSAFKDAFDLLTAL
jgi:hypothetical protein